MKILKYSRKFFLSLVLLWPITFGAAPEPPVVIDTEEVQCLTEALYYEARNVDQKELEAIMSVIYNRKHSMSYPRTYCGVVYQYRQFSYTLTDFQSPQKHARSPEDRLALARVSTLAFKAVYGDFKPSLKPSVMWYARHYVKNTWVKTFRKVKELKWHGFYEKVDIPEKTK